MPRQPIMRQSIVWYRAETYDAVRALMEDAASLPPSFEKFLYRALKAEEQLRRRGLTPVRVYLDEHEFPAFCRERSLGLNAQARMEYSAAIAHAMFEADQAGKV